MLQNGIYIDDISYPNIKAKQLYIKWNEKLSVVIKELDLKKSKNEKQSKIKIQKIETILEEIVLFDTIFEKVIIEKIHYNDIDGSFKYIDGKNGYLQLSSPKFKLKTSLFFQSHLFNIQVDSFKAINKDISASGNIILNTYDATELTTSLDINILKDINLHLYANTNLEKLRYKIESKNDIKSIKPIIDKYASSWQAKWWVRDAIDMSSLTINNIYGYLEYNHFEEAYKNLHVDAIVNNLKYTYNEELDVIDTSHTELEFKNGALYIRPKNAYTYKTFLDKSWLKIDFATKDPMVNLHLLFEGILNKDLLYLLSVYKINLPFIQTKGKLKTDLNLDINLRTTDVEAHGTFYTKNAWINYLGLDLHVFDTNVVLNNTNVSVKNMYAKYEDIATSHLDILFDAKKDIGKLDFRVDSTTFKDIGVSLKTQKKALHVEYIINPEQDYIIVDKSKWNIDDIDINLDAAKLPFDINTTTATLPKTSLESKNFISAIVSGKILFNPLRAKLNLDIKSLNRYNTSLNQDNLKLSVNYDTNLSITSSEEIELKTSKDLYTLNNMNIKIADKHLYIKDMNLSAKNLFTSNMSLNYNLKMNKGLIDINNINIKNKTFQEIFKTSKTTKLNIKNHNDNIIIQSKDYGIKYILNNQEWQVEVNSIKNIAKKSKLLKKYFIDNGSLIIEKKYNQNYMTFLAKTNYKYKLLVVDNKPIENYTIDGRLNLDTKNINLNLNHVFNINIKDDIKMNTKDIGINLKNVISLVSDINSSDSNNSYDIYFKSKNAYVYINEKRHAISDTISFTYKNQSLNAILKHKKGIAVLKYTDNKIFLKGKKFEDKFMTNLFALSDIKGGMLEFTIKGIPKKYKGVMYIKDATLVDYKILNNVLAFVNTVPALLTFSLPGYNKNGLKVDKLYFNFEFENDIYNISNFSIDSKELKILGKGKASIKNNTINMDMNLKTDLGSSVSKIPVVGYILLGDDTVSTSLTLTGKLDDPKVNTQVAKDIVVAPWNILKRTLTYPMKLFESDENKKK